MNKKSEYIKENHLGIILSLVIIIVCILALIWVYGYDKQNSLIGEIVKNIVLTALISVTIGTVFTFLTKDSIKNDVRKTINEELDTISNFKKLGLSKVYLDAKDYNFKDLLLNSQDLSILINDGKAWKSTYSSEINSRLKKIGYSTKFILLDLENNDDLNTLMIRKTKHEDDINYIRNKINIVESTLKEVTVEGHNLEIIKHNLFNPYSVFMSNEEAVVTPYRVSRGKDTVPLYVYKKPDIDCGFGCQKCELNNFEYINEYCRLRKDLNNLETDIKN